MTLTFVRVFVAGGVLAGGVLAQHRGGVVGGRFEFRTFGSPSGFGNVVFPGVGTAPRITPSIIGRPSFAQRLGATVSGWPAYTGAPAFGGVAPAAYPVAYPVYVGGYYGYDQPMYQQQPPPNITIVMPPQPQPQAQATPPVTIHQHFTPDTPRSVIREYGTQQESVQTYQAPGRQPEAAPEPEVMFLIGLKDSTVYSAVAYWVEGETLHYITTQGRHNQVSLDLVDRTLSEKLNRGRKIEFHLPPANK